MNAVDILIGLAIALQSWTLKEIVGLKMKIAQLPCHPDDTCPSEQNKKRMKSYLKIISLVSASLLLVVLVGCTTANPNPPVFGQPYQAFLPDTASISNSLVVARSAIQATAPVNPWSGLLETLAGAVAAIVTGVSIVVARAKSAKAAKAEAVADTLAQGVVKAGASPAVLDHASYSPVYSEVANRVNNATP